MKNIIPYIRGYINDNYYCFFPVIEEILRNNEEEGFDLTIMEKQSIMVHITAGFRDKDRNNWQYNTVCPCFSTSKAVVTVVIGYLLSNKILNINDQIQDICPEIKHCGSLGEILSHQYGVPSLSFAQPKQKKKVQDILNECPSLWKSGEKHGYHPKTWGMFLQAIVYAKTGKSIGTIFRDNIQSTDLHKMRNVFFLKKDIGKEYTIADIQKPRGNPFKDSLNEIQKKVFIQGWGKFESLYHDKELPGVTLYANSYSLCHVLSILTNNGFYKGKQVIDAHTWKDMTNTYCSGEDMTLTPQKTSWGLGIMTNEYKHFGTNENTFGHYGWGGSMVLCAPHKNITLCFLTRCLHPTILGDERNKNLIKTIDSL